MICSDENSSKPFIGIEERPVQVWGYLRTFQFEIATSYQIGGGGGVLYYNKEVVNQGKHHLVFCVQPLTWPTKDRIEKTFKQGFLGLGCGKEYPPPLHQNERTEKRRYAPPLTLSVNGAGINQCNNSKCNGEGKPLKLTILTSKAFRFYPYHVLFSIKVSLFKYCC